MKTTMVTYQYRVKGRAASRALTRTSSVVSRGTKRSLGWSPFKVGGIKLSGVPRARGVEDFCIFKSSSAREQSFVAAMAIMAVYFTKITGGKEKNKPSVNDRAEYVIGTSGCRLSPELYVVTIRFSDSKAVNIRKAEKTIINAQHQSGEIQIFRV